MPRHHMRTAAIAAMLLCAPLALTHSQETATVSDAQLRERAAKHRSDFDYLLGDWRFSARSTQWGTFSGVWSAVRLSTGGGGTHVLDEYRVLDDSGHTIVASSTLRAYNAARDRWELVTVDEIGGLQDVGIGRRVGDEMHIEQTFDATSATPSTWRIRYHDIRADSFQWVADRSLDGGTSWEREHMTIKARRVGPARELGPLTRPSEVARPAQGRDR